MNTALVVTRARLQYVTVVRYLLSNLAGFQNFELEREVRTRSAHTIQNPSVVRDERDRQRSSQKPTPMTMDAALSDRKRKADAFEWEASKENVMPLKRGRNVADLNKALRAHDSFQTKLRLEDELKAKQDAVEAYNGDDPLAAWLEYIRWLEVKMPEDTRKKFTALEKCTRELKDNPHYKNDMRYIRLWIQYADLVSNPKDIFKYLYQNKIGERVSLFYIGWAYVLETMANYPQAHKIYLKAGQKNAEPQDLLERKYKEFQRRMSRQWLRMTEETGANGIDERQQLHQHRASARVQRIQKANAHKPLGTMQQQDKENEMAPSAWNTLAARGESGAGAGRQSDRRSPPGRNSRPQDASTLQVFVDEEFSVSESEQKRRTPLTHRSQTLRQRLDGVATEEEMLAQEPLKNFTASDKKARAQKQVTKGRSEKSCYDVEQITSSTGDAISFEEIRASAYQQAVDRHRELEHRALHDVTHEVDSASNVTLSLSAATSSVTASVASHRANPSAPTTTSSTSREVESPERKPAPLATAAQTAAVSTHNGEQEDMTINTRVALEDINSMFCSPPRQPKPSVWGAKEGDPVERKLHFSVFEDSVDSVALNAQDQSQRQDINESIPKQTFQVFKDDASAEPLVGRKQDFQIFSDGAPEEPRTGKAFQVFSDDVPEEPRTGKTSWSQKRKPLGARDDLVCSVRLTNKDVLMRVQKDAAEKDSTESRWIQGTTKNLAREGSSRNITQPTPKSVTHLSTKVPVAALVLDPYTFENRQNLILDRRVDWYLCSRPDAVKLHSQTLPRVPCTNPVKRKLPKPIVFKASTTLTVQLVGVLGSGSFAYVFSAKVVDTTINSTRNKAVKIEKERQNLAWGFYITNKIKKKLRIERGIPDEKIPVPTLTELHLFSNGALLIMDKGHVGTLFDVLNCYKQWGTTFPEVLAVYYGIKMLRCIELLHSANVLHGDIKPDNWLMIPGNPSSELELISQEPKLDKVYQAGDLYLIDYGRSIDLSFYPDGTVFRGSCHAKGFQCVEMLTQRPWTYQIDTFAFCGTMHCMLFGEYMEVKPKRNAKGATHWGIVRQFKRYWQVDMWENFFHVLLNVHSCTDQPSLLNLRRRMERYFVSDRSRQQELFKQLSRQDSVLRKTTV
ncbi:BUB protein kinase [Phytophthora nicotianae]|uniref:BUB protein kinase n=1 Tax=Phytophthora nicotianae TaxID=4792 RepID=W2NNJ7_PHYNI|nr:BUB protein kinase [Phytophthora nicotianae]